MIAIYLLFWALSLFLVLPFGVRTADEAGEAKIPGQADSAPAHFRPMRIFAFTTLVAAILFGLYYGNYVFGWIGVDQLNFFHPPGMKP